MRLQQFRILSSLVLMVLGVVIIIRGLQNSLQRGLGWRGILMSCFLGMLIFALGLARWRFLRQR
jgi:hypothetical protein